MKDLSTAAEIVKAIDACNRKTEAIVNSRLMWEDCYIKMQIDKREVNEPFSINDHIKGMCYSLLSGGVSWREIEGNLKAVDKALHQYDPQFILNTEPDQLVRLVRDCGVNVRYDKRLIAIIANTKTLAAITQNYGSIDGYYKSYITETGNVTGLIARLSEVFYQMGPALTAEYLRNVGYDVGKPDTHLMRLLSRNYLGYTLKDKDNPYEVIEVISEIAQSMGKHQAEVDNILWLFCARNLGICQSDRPQCDSCPITKLCNHFHN